MINDELTAESLARDLNTRILAHRIVYYERIGSTNDVARQLADAGEPEGTLVIADEQSAGRGRLGRVWCAPARSSLLMSLVLRPALPPFAAPRVTMAIALGAVEAIRAMTGLPAQIKWPNDLQIRGKKFAGILAESGIVGEQLEYVIVGIGINVNFDPTQVSGIPADATSLAMELRRAVPRAPLAQAILRASEAQYARLRAGENLRDAYKERLVTLGQFIRAQTPHGTVIGHARDVDENGALILQRADGTLVHLQAGDITLADNQPQTLRGER